MHEFTEKYLPNLDNDPIFEFEDWYEKGSLGFSYDEKTIGTHMSNSIYLLNDNIGNDYYASAKDVGNVYFLSQIPVRG